MSNATLITGNIPVNKSANNSNVINGIIELKKAKDLFEDAVRSWGENSKGAKLVKVYIKKIDWIYNDMVTFPKFPDQVIDGIRKEWASDSFTVDAITEKVALLSPEQRDSIERVIDKVLSGDSLEIEYHQNY